MATATLERPVEPGAPPPVPEEPRRVPRWALGLAVLAGWIVMWSFTKNPANGVVTATLDVTGLIAAFDNQIALLTGENADQQAQIDDLLTRVAALEAAAAGP